MELRVENGSRQAKKLKNKMNLPEIKKFLDSEAGQSAKDFLMGELMELRQIDNLKEYDTPTAQTIEIKSQKKAFEKIKNILEKLMTIQESDIKKPERDRYDA